MQFLLAVIIIFTSCCTALAEANDGVNNIPRLHSILEPRKTEAEQEFLANQFATAFTNELMNVLDLPADKRETSSDENQMTSETNQKPEKGKTALLNRASAKSLKLQTVLGANQKREKEKAASLNRASPKSLKLQTDSGANQKRDKEKAALLNRASAKSLELPTVSGTNKSQDVNRKQEKLGKTGGAHEENRMASRRGSWSGTKRRFRGRDGTLGSYGKWNPNMVYPHARPHNFLSPQTAEEQEQMAQKFAEAFTHEMMHALQSENDKRAALGNNYMQSDDVENERRDNEMSLSNPLPPRVISQPHTTDSETYKEPEAISKREDFSGTNENRGEDSKENLKRNLFGGGGFGDRMGGYRHGGGWGDGDGGDYGGGSFHVNRQQNAMWHQVNRFAQKAFEKVQNAAHRVIEGSSRLARDVASGRGGDLLRKRSRFGGQEKQNSNLDVEKRIHEEPA